MVVKKSSKVLLVVAVSAIIVTGLAVAISQGLRTLSSNFGGLTSDFSDLQESERQVTFPFNFTELPEYFAAGLTLNGSGYADQPHIIGIWIGHNRPDSSVWLASGDYSLTIEKDGGIIEPIISNNFSGLRNTVPFEDKGHSWTSPSDNGMYDFVLSLTNLEWTMIQQYTITVSLEGEGTIKPGTATYLAGESQDFVISPDPGYKIKTVLDNGEEVSDIPDEGGIAFTILNIDMNHIIHATFVPITYTITATEGTGGSITPNGSIVVLAGDDQEFIITPDEGYVIEDILVNEAYIESFDPYVFSYPFDNVQSNHTIDARFTDVPVYFEDTFYESKNGYILDENNVSLNGKPLPVVFASGDTVTMQWTIGNTNVGTYSTLKYYVEAQIGVEQRVRLITEIDEGVPIDLPGGGTYTITDTFTAPAAGSYILILHIELIL